MNMSRFRPSRFKPEMKVNNSTNDKGEGGNKENAIENQNNNSPESPNGLFGRISKRYSTFSHKIVRKHFVRRHVSSPQKNVSGSYDMTGAHSDDHRLEIGAPVLISKTTLDIDGIDVSEARLMQTNGSVDSSFSPLSGSVTANSSPPMPSSGSENEVFVDALNLTPRTDEEEENFETPKRIPNGDARTQLQFEKESTPESFKSGSSNESKKKESTSSLVNPLSTYYEITKPALNKDQLGMKQHSKSAQNLHRSEMKVYLQKADLIEMNVSSTTVDSEHCRDLPKLPELFGASMCSLAPTDNEGNDADKENSSPSTDMTPPQSKSEPNTPMCPDQKVCGYLSQQPHFKSIDSLNLQRRSLGKRGSVNFNSSSSNSVNQSGSKHSLASHNSTIENFDLKSVSCQSLNAQSLFVSIDELNEITRQINESEEFNREIDFEYCTHRDNLKPSERRITMLKPKHSRLMRFNNNKEKLMKGWSDVKHWIGEESTKIREAVHKQTALPLMGSSRTTSNMDLRKSSSTVESTSGLRLLHRGASMDRTTNNCVSKTTSLYSLQRGRPEMQSRLNFVRSCENIAEENEFDCDDLESRCTEAHDDDGASVSKRTKTEGQNGFEDLRRYIKQGGDFGKELILIMQERVDTEILYSKSLSKMATKLNKACRELPGSIAEAWRGVATEMESRSDIHRQLSASLAEELVKPLKSIVETHHKTRKSIESNVDKASRTLAEWRVSEAKAKKSSHAAARENEKLQDAMLDVRIQKSPSIALLHQGPNKLAAEKEIKSAEKDCAKLDNKRKKAEEAVKRADVEYYTLCVRAERARVDWEMAVLRGSSVLQNIENQRLVHMKNFVLNYARLTSNMNPVLGGLMQRLQPHVDSCNVVKDMQVVNNIRRNSEGPSEQLLPDFYCEHTTLAMNRERRKHSLIKLLQLVKTDLERERRSRNGLKGFSQSLNSQENQNITDKLYHIRSMLTYLEGARFKLQSALLELDHKPRTSHPLAQHIQITRDRTGLQQSILKVPLWLKNNEKVNTVNSEENTSRENEYEIVSPQTNTSNTSYTDINIESSSIKNFNRSKSSIETFNTSTQICFINSAKTKTMPANIDDPYSDRGQADGGSNQQDSDFDEFSSQDDEESTSPKTAVIISKGTKTDSSMELLSESIQTASDSNTNGSAPQVLSRCKALYSYSPKLYDELELTPGDIIEVHAKQEDGWWLGALGNSVGIFPATYVEEIS